MTTLEACERELARAHAVNDELRAALKEALDGWHGYILSEGCGQVLDAYEGEAARIDELRKLVSE